MSNARRSLIILALLAVAACVPQPVPRGPVDWPQKVMPGALEAECNQLYNTNARGRRLSWKGAVPIVMSFAPGFPPHLIPAIQSAMASWNEAAGFTLFAVRPGAPNVISFMDKNDAGRAERARLNDHFAKESMLSVTTYFYRGNRIVKADIFWDGVNHDFSTSWFHLASADVEATALHELGHVLGLTHNPDLFSSVMFPFTLGFGIAYRKIDPTSKRMLECEYK